MGYHGPEGTAPPSSPSQKPRDDTMASPLLGYNTNVRHSGSLYHIQTEDSGINHPHIITHLFADGGRIIASKKTTYAEHVGADGFKVIVKKLMQEQHKGMFIALRDGIYDEDELGQAKSRAPTVDVDALERAATRLAMGAPTVAGAPAPTPIEGAPPNSGPAKTPPPSSAPTRARTKPPESIFGSDLLSEKSLDEVILSYLAEDLDD